METTKRPWLDKARRSKMDALEKIEFRRKVQRLHSEGMNISEISREVNRSLSTVRSYLLKARPYRKSGDAASKPSRPVVTVTRVTESASFTTSELRALIKLHEKGII